MEGTRAGGHVLRPAPLAAALHTPPGRASRGTRFARACTGARERARQTRRCLGLAADTTGRLHSNWNAEPARPEAVLHASSACNGTWPLLRVCHCRRDPVIDHLCPSPMSCICCIFFCLLGLRSPNVYTLTIGCVLHSAQACSRRPLSSGAVWQRGNVAAGSTEWRDGRILPGQADGQHGSAAAGQRSYVLS